MEDVSFLPVGVTEYFKHKDISLEEMNEPSDSNWRCFNTGGVEIPVGEFLYGLVRMIRPENVFETGTHLGISSSYIAQALKDNKTGLLTTVEIEKQHIKASRERWHRLEVENWILCDKEESLEYDLEYDCELFFLDSEPHLRFKELVRFYSRLKPGGFAIIHDLHRGMCQGNINPDHPDYKSWPFGDLPEQIYEWVLKGELRVMHGTTPRGITMFYKVHPDDHIWGRGVNGI